DLEELNKFTSEIARARMLPKQVLDALRLMPKETHPMDMLRTGVSMLGAFDPELNDHSHAANIRKSIRLIAKVSTLITDGYRIAHGKSPLPEREDLTLAGNLFYKLRGEVPQDWQIQMMDTIFILYADHEFNASTFAARVTASTLADIYAAVTSACAALKGPLHGGANEQSMRMLDEIKSPDRAEGWLKDQLAKKAKIMGFGHRVYKKGDSRVPVMREIGRDLGERTGKENWIPICEKLEQTMEREKHLCANVDLYAAPVFTMLGFDPALNTPIFAASRVAGWCAHVVEQHDHNRLIRPTSLYTGPANAEGLRIRSFPKGDEVIAEWKPEQKYEAFPGVLNGGIIGTLLDCHCNWTAAWHLMNKAGADHPPCTVTADYAIKLLRPTP